MLKLIDIKKDYEAAGTKVPALKGVSLEFRKSEFVCILGASGCGKTTLLNIIGGLDHYTSGDLVIRGVSTKDFKDRDWDVYRNHRIGFVFQSYNLIPHQTVVGNVELALTIAGLSKTERRRRALEALRRVGLEAEVNKRPNQLSGGQMQRVAIARALVNNPEILLADEPTGALDSKTSVQIMDLIREIAGERLVIMVTHNPELADKYATRIVRLHDGLVVADSDPYDSEEERKSLLRKLEYRGWTTEQMLDWKRNKQAAEKAQKKANRKEKASMSYLTSLGLSGRNLLAKKGRTVVTSIAGSIGIISVCLVLALSNGFNGYIRQTQEDMLSSAPLEITETTLDMSAIMMGMQSIEDMPELDKIGDRVYVNSFLTNIAQGMTVTNDLSDGYLSYLESMDESWYTAIQYSTGMILNNNMFTEVEIENETGDTETAVMSLSELKAYYTLKLTQQEEKYASLAYLVDYLGAIYGKMPGTADLQDDEFGEYVLSQYDLIGENSRFPETTSEAVLVIGQNNDVTDLTLAQLGFIGEEEFLSLFPAEGQDSEELGDTMIPFDEIIGKKYVLNYNNAVYEKTTDPTSPYIYAYKGRRASLGDGGEDGIGITISGVLRLKEGLNYGCLGNGLFVTEALCNEYQAVNMQSEIAKSLREQAETVAEFNAKIKTLSEMSKEDPSYDMKIAEFYAFFMRNTATFRRMASTVETYYMSGSSMVGETTADSAESAALLEAFKNTHFLYGDSAIREVGGKNKVNGISIYTDTFENKEKIVSYLDEWNETHEKGEKVKYTDTVGLMMGMVEDMLNAVTYVLVAFTAISLVVSSVMIGIITYVSVVERTKEIGVLRALGARKKDISNLFNAETFIIGLSSGVFGVAVTYLLSFGINALLKSLTGIATLASLPFTSAAIMVAVSVVLTLISGLVPARAAARKDPVVALRTE